MSFGRDLSTTGNFQVDDVESPSGVESLWIGGTKCGFEYGHVKLDSDSLQWSTDGAATSLTATRSGGGLHGQWKTEAVLATSDRRVKTKINSLRSDFGPHLSRRGGSGSLTGRRIHYVDEFPEHGEEPSDVAPVADEMVAFPEGRPSWLLRELRPVSFIFRNVETKGASVLKRPCPREGFLRFGFVAQDLERVLPFLVHRPAARAGAAWLSIAYVDLVALLTMDAKQRQLRLDNLKGDGGDGEHGGRGDEQKVGTPSLGFASQPERRTTMKARCNGRDARAGEDSPHALSNFKGRGKQGAQEDRNELNEQKTGSQRQPRGDELAPWPALDTRKHQGLREFPEIIQLARTNVAGTEVSLLALDLDLKTEAQQIKSLSIALDRAKRRLQRLMPLALLQIRRPSRTFASEGRIGVSVPR